MNGAYCLHCGPLGPDLIVPKGQADQVPVSTVIRIAFTCGNCGGRCTWRATKTATGWEYRPADPVVPVVH